MVSSTASAFKQQFPDSIAAESMDTSGVSSPLREASPQPSVELPFVMHRKNKMARIDDSRSASGSRPEKRRRLTVDVVSPRQGPQTFLMASANVRNNPANQQRAKRNSTSPGEEEGSSTKRPRPSPGGDHPNPPGPPQNQPSMMSMVPFNPWQGGGPPGPQNMQNGMIRPPMNMAHQTIF